MPSNPEIDRELAALAEAKKHGQPLAFGRNQANTYSTPAPRPSQFQPAQDLVDAEALFGQACVSLGAQLRTVLGAMALMQRARMAAFGQGPTPEEVDFQRQRPTFSSSPPPVDEQGFVTKPQG